AFLAQFFTQLGQLDLLLRFELRYGLAIDSSCPCVAPDRPKAGLQIALRNDFVPESIPYGCRLACFEPGQHALGPYLLFYPPPSVANISGLLRLLRASHSRRSSF